MDDTVTLPYSVTLKVYLSHTSKVAVWLFYQLTNKQMESNSFDLIGNVINGLRNKYAILDKPDI